MKSTSEEICLSDADRRAYPRCPVVVKEAKFTYGREVFFGYAANISRSGLFISTARMRNPGDIFDIEFSLPGEPKRAFSCKAKVMWARPYRQESFCLAGFGLQFIDLPEGDADFIGEWVERVCLQTGQKA